MSRPLTMSPFPRLDAEASPPSEIQWGPITLMVGDRIVEESKLHDIWDRNATLKLGVSVQVSVDALKSVQARGAFLSVTAACRSTAWSHSCSIPLRRSGKSSDTLFGIAEVSIPGSEVAEELRVDASLTSPWPGQSNSTWLRRRIIAARATELITLTDRDEGFPTTAISFKDRRWRSVPWIIDFESLEPSDAFNQNVRLYLNQDLEAVRALIDGTEDRQRDAVLQMAVMRALIQHASVITDRNPDVGLDQEAQENPGSIADAAHRVAVDHLKYTTLADAVSDVRRNPNQLERRIMEFAEYLV